LGIAGLILASSEILHGIAVFCQLHEGSIYLFSCVIGAFTWFMLYMAHRRIRSEKWINYLASMFLFLGLQYFILLIIWINTAHPQPSNAPPSDGLEHIKFFALQTLSIVTNLFGVAAARDIQNRKSLLPNLTKGWRKGKARKADREKWLLPRWCAVLAIIAFVASFVPLLVAASGNVAPFDVQLVVSAPESAFSAICLAWLGYVIFANLSSRRRPWLSLIAVSMAVIYAALQIAFGLSSILADWLIGMPERGESEKLFVSSLRGFALPLKIVLAGFSYALVARFLETLSDLRRLQDSGFSQRQDYLSSDGVITTIAERLKDQLSIRERIKRLWSARRAKEYLEQHLSVTTPQKDLMSLEAAAELGNVAQGANSTTETAERFQQRGFVNLTIKLPGELNKRVVCIFWPNNAIQKKPKVFDWKLSDHSFSFIKSDEFQKVEDDERNEPIVAELLNALPFASVVLTDEKITEIVWPEDELDALPNVARYKGTMKAIVSVSIRASGAAIGCLQIGRSKSPFSQMAIRQIREIANLLSPAVQAYRELAGLDLMSIRFAAAQAEESTYSPECATEAIGKILHDIFNPTVTRLYINFGFATQQPYVKCEPLRENVALELEESLKGKEWKDYRDELEADGKYRLLKKGFTARVTETLIQQQPSKRDRLIMGNLILAVNYEKDRYGHAALGSTYLHRKTASTLAADAFLDFQRDYYNDLLKKLGRELSEKRVNIEEWFEPIQRILTTEAGLSWVAARQHKSTLGDEQALCLIGSLKKPHAERIRLNGYEPLRHHYVLTKEELNSKHVLTFWLPNANAFIWLGIKREQFGAELEFASPWRTFLVNLGQIADASLSRITFPEKFQLHLEAAQLQGIIASMATTGTVIHQFRNMIAGQRNSLETLLRGIKLGELTGDGEHQEIIEGMYDTSVEMLEVFQSISRLTPTDGQHACQLVEAADYAVRLYDVPLKTIGVETEIRIADTIYVDVPFTVVGLTFATLVGNAKDAIKEKFGASSRNRKGKIVIEADVASSEVICRVSDNGRGMSQVARGIIFEPKRSTKRFGTGMGLYLTSHSLSENRSKIELISSDENGSTFLISFPLAKKEVAANASNRESNSNGDSNAEVSFGS
jgi:signal transduction histidine kinase